MGGTARAWLLVVADRQALGWILREQRTAFPAERSALCRTLAPGDRLIIYTTRGCFRNPTRDRGRVIGTATVTTPVAALDLPVVFGDRAFAIGCDIAVGQLAPLGRGPELAPLAPLLRTFPATWSVHLRRALAPLDDHDYGLLERAIAPVAVSRQAALAGYLARALPVRRPAALAD